MSNEETPHGRGCWLQKVLACAQGATALMSALLLLSMMGVTVVDTVGRYFLNHPLAGAAEWVELTMGIVVFAGLFQAAYHREHVRIDLLDRFWSAGAERIVKTIANLASLLVMLFLSWRLWSKAVELHDFGDVSSYLGIPLAPVAVFMAFMILLSALVYTLHVRTLYARCAFLPPIRSARRK